MNTAERLDYYQNRGFSQETAATNLLLEEALQILFARFPDAFIFFGGASLVLFYGSSRHSGDLDLLVSSESRPSVGKEIYDQLEHLDFEPLPAAPTELFSEWL